MENKQPKSCDGEIQDTLIAEVMKQFIESFTKERPNKEQWSEYMVKLNQLFMAKYAIVAKKHSEYDRATKKWDIVFGRACSEGIDEDVNKYISTRDGTLYFVEEVLKDVR